MRILLVLVALLTAGCGDDITHPTYIPQTIYPVGPPVCTVSNGVGLLIVPCD